jgi:hypothetical protein
VSTVTRRQRPPPRRLGDLRNGAVFFLLAASRTDQVSPEGKDLRVSLNLSDEDGSHENRCFDRVMLETTMSSMNRALRNSDGTSIIVQGLRCAEAEDKEYNRRNGAAGDVNSENVQGLSLRTSQPSAVKFDGRITLQPKIAATP